MSVRDADAGPVAGDRTARTGTPPAPVIPAGWLSEQLPAVMAEDDFLRRYVGIVEEVAGSVRRKLDGLEEVIDPTLAPPEFVRWLGSWLGVAVDATLPLERQRAVVRAAGPLLPWRGTRRGVEGMLAAVTGGAVAVRDEGTVSGPGRARRRPGGVVEVELETSARLDLGRLADLVQDELPPGAVVEVRLRDPH